MDKSLSDIIIIHSENDVLAAYNSDYFDTVLLDIMLPDIPGLLVSKEIRKTNSHIPIVALTSIPYSEIDQELANSGINHYISKPPQAIELQNLLKEYFKPAA
ncbi:MAG: hypothetical protein COA58_09035 [Bacteroidetes bacterium]|nr:MAG: hypothetical protein COA58_09035 [Bacteroidota bacterium]